MIGGLLLAIAVLIFGAYKGLGALPLTILAALVAIVTNAIPLWDGFATHYMAGYPASFSRPVPHVQRPGPESQECLPSRLCVQRVHSRAGGSGRYRCLHSVRNLIGKYNFF